MTLAEMLPSGPDSDPLQLAIAAERYWHMRRIMAGLTNRQFEVLILRYTHNWTLDQVGEKFGVTGVAVYQIEQRAIVRLRKRLEAEHLTAKDLI